MSGPEIVRTVLDRVLPTLGEPTTIGGGVGLSTLGKAARRYPEVGAPVFRCRPRDKRPATAHGFKDATTDVAVVEAEWSRDPEANIGLAAGRGFADVLDLDGDEGIDNFDGWCSAQGWSLNVNEMVIAGTGSGGQHWYFQPTGCGNRAGMLAKVDWRGQGGYVVAPPSVHPNGEPYIWCPGLSPWDHPIPICPPALADLVRRTGGELSQEPGPVPAPFVATKGVTGYGLGALRSACERITGAVEGTRNDTLNREAVGIYSLVAGGHLFEGYAERVLVVAAAACGLDEREARRTLRSARAKGVTQPRRAS